MTSDTDYENIRRGIEDSILLAAIGAAKTLSQLHAEVIRQTPIPQGDFPEIIRGMVKKGVLEKTNGVRFPMYRLPARKQ